MENYSLAPFHQTNGATIDQTNVHTEYTVHVINCMAKNDIKHKANQCLPELGTVLSNLFAVSMSPSLTALRTVSSASAPVEDQEE